MASATSAAAVRWTVLAPVLRGAVVLRGIGALREVTVRAASVTGPMASVGVRAAWAEPVRVSIACASRRARDGDGLVPLGEVRALAGHGVPVTCPWTSTDI
ncbi:hypothetical protein FAM22021_000142 [Propionibacterium freudenreichii]|nr:hypothetical protein [Propionibacterium freudenreichii]